MLFPVIPELGQCLGAVSLWQECVGQGSVFSVSAERFLHTVSTVYSGFLPERADTGKSSSSECVYAARVTVP